jgi:hypothetical protein
MGVDKADVRRIIHNSIPKTLENYTQGNFYLFIIYSLIIDYLYYIFNRDRKSR